VIIGFSSKSSHYAGWWAESKASFGLLLVGLVVSKASIKPHLQLTLPPFITKATFRDVTSIVRMVIIIVIVHLFVNKPSNRFEFF